MLFVNCQAYADSVRERCVVCDGGSCRKSVQSNNSLIFLGHSADSKRKVTYVRVEELLRVLTRQQVSAAYFFLLKTPRLSSGL
jgi:hypothetical protein